MNPKPCAYEASTNIFNKFLNYQQFLSHRYLKTNILFKIQSVYVFYLISKQYTCEYITMEKVRKY